MEACRGKPRRGDVRREVWEVQGRNRRKDRKKGKASAKKQGGIGETRRDVRGIEGSNRNENVFVRPNALRETLKLLFRHGELDLPERRKRCTGSREEEIDTQMCPCGEAIESRTHIAG